MKIAVKDSQRFPDGITPGDAAIALKKLSDKCFEALGQPGSLTAIHLNQTSVGTDMLTVIAEVEA